MIFKDLNGQGLVGPFQVTDVGVLDRLIHQLKGLAGNYRNVHLVSPACRQLLADENLVANVATAFGDNLVLWRTNSFRKESGAAEVRWHHDRHFESAETHIDFDNLSNHFSILVALNDMNEHSGIMEFCLGSHVSRLYADRDTRPFHQRSISEHFIELPESLLKSCVKVPLKRGQFLLFHSGLLHRSLSAYGSSVDRFSFVARLCRKETLIPEQLAKMNEVIAYPLR